MKNLLSLSFFLYWAVSLQAQAPSQKYRVLVATYDKPVPTSYFTDAGLEDITMEIDQNQLARYYVQGKFATESEAMQVQELVIEKGFKNASIIDLDKLNTECAKVCKPIPAGILSPQGVVGIIYFDFDKDFLRPESKEELEVLYSILTEYPDYRVKMKAHTDALGTDTYNTDLAQRRGQQAKDYLLRQGIAENRMAVEVIGASKPIAKNTTEDGKDLPEGRQYNRRVEFVLMDGQGRVLSEMVEDVDIPAYLKAY